jgi:hypothetical protein
MSAFSFPTYLLIVRLSVWRNKVVLDIHERHEEDDYQGIYNICNPLSTVQTKKYIPGVFKFYK